MISIVSAGELIGSKPRITDQRIVVRVSRDAGEGVMQMGVWVLNASSLKDCAGGLNLPPLRRHPVHDSGRRQIDHVRAPERTIAQHAIHEPGIIRINQSRSAQLGKKISGGGVELPGLRGDCQSDVGFVSLLSYRT